MSNNQTRMNVLSNLIWRLAERSGAQIISFVVSMILARILAPEVYGTLSLIMVFTVILYVFVDSGLGNALIQKKDADDLDFSTVFYTNLVFCVLLYGFMFVAAPLISKFYNNTSLTALIRVLSLTLIISGVKNVQQAYVSRNMMFKKFFFATLGGTVTAAIVGIVLAYQGYGAWALVAQQIVNMSIDTCVLWFTVRWRPKKQFSFERLKGLFSFGSKLLASSLLDAGYKSLRQLVIGKMYSSADLAFYERGDKFPNFIVNNINASLDSVLLPTMAKEQESREQVKKMVRRSIMMSTYIMAPLMMGMAFAAPTIIETLLTEKWLSCVTYLRIFCISYMFYPIHTANLNAIKALGRSDIFLKLEIIKKTIGITLLIVSLKYGVFFIAISELVSSVFAQMVNSWPNKKLLGYSYLEQLFDIMPSIIIAIIMGIVVLFVEKIQMMLVLKLVFEIVIGFIVYFVLSFVLKLEAFQYLWEIIKPERKDNWRE